VDIDPLAVEVTKFSLFLKLLEDTDIEEINSFMESSHELVLPRLDNNIKNGNSLVGIAYAQYDPDVFEREGALEEIRMFDWTAEFGKNGFDAIVGNPPYIRVQNMKQRIQSYWINITCSLNVRGACLKPVALSVILSRISS